MTTTGHAPAEEITHTVLVTCTASGPMTTGGDTDTPYPATTLADLEAFCARLRERGATSTTPIRGPAEISALIDLGGS